MLKAGLLLVAVPLVAVVTPPQGPTVFRSGTRLVEVEVVVRGKPVPPPGFREALKSALVSGPPFGPPGDVIKGLTKDDFEIFDEGKPEPISVFRAGASADAKPVALPPGAVSNRLDSRGQPLNGATVVLIDLLNTHFDYTDYARLGTKDLLHSLAETDTRLGVYWLGESLHILQDFADDPKKLMETAAKLDQPKRGRPRELDGALGDFGDLLALGGADSEAVAAEIHGQMTLKALRLIIQHLSGVPGRKNLVWLMDTPNLPRALLAMAHSMAQQADIYLYPVTERCPDLCGHQADEITGGRQFYDARDLTFAVRTAEEDSRSSYVLGFYPYENLLDGKYHKLTVKLKNAKLNQVYEVRYRLGYFATKVALPVPPPTPQELFEGPVDSTRIGLSAQAAADAEHPGLYSVNVTVDLRDIHLDAKEGHFMGAFDLSIPNPSMQHTVRTTTVAVDLTQQQLAGALENGFTGSVNGVESASGEIRVAVRDRATGAAGSVRIPITAGH